MVVRRKWDGMRTLRGGRELLAPELLELRAAPSGGVAALMVGAAWFGFGGEEEETKSSRPDDFYWDLVGAAYLNDQTSYVARSIAQPEPAAQFSVGFWTQSAVGDATRDASTEQLAVAYEEAADMIVRAVDTLSHGAVDTFDWIDDLPLLDDLAAAIAGGQFAGLRAGFVPSGVTLESAGIRGFVGSTVTLSNLDDLGGGVSSAVGDGFTAREHGTVRPLQLAPPQAVSENAVGGAEAGDLGLISTMSGGSGGSGGGSPPCAYNDYYQVCHDHTLAVPANGVLWNDYWGQEPAAISGHSYQGGGQLSLGANGGFTYTPPPDWAGTEVFSYTITNSIASSQAYASIYVGNAPPQAANDLYTIPHDTTLEITDPEEGLLENDHDSDHAKADLTLAIKSGPSNGQLTDYDDDGTFTYEPDAEWAGTDTFTYSLHDGIVEGNEATVTIIVGNTPPDTDPDSYTAITNTQLVIPSARWPGVEGALDNDEDPDGDEFSVSWYDQPQHGSLSLAADGSFTYMPQNSYAGGDSFHYRISDGIAESGDQLVAINVILPLVDLDTDSDNTGVIEHSQLEDDDEMVAPGKILRYNADDDNANDVDDRLEAPLTGPGGPVQDNDLYPVELAVGAMLPQMEGFTLEISHSATIKLWNDQSKSSATSLTYTIGTDTIPSVFFVEGFSTGTGQVQCVLKNDSGVVVNQDAVLTTIVDVRLKGYTPQTSPFVPFVVADTRKGEHDIHVRRNGDDDDSNTTADWQDTNVSGEDDLIQVDVHASPTFPSQVGYTLERSGDAVKVWSTASKGNCYLDSSGRFRSPEVTIRCGSNTTPQGAMQKA